MLPSIVWIKLEYAFNTHWNVAINCSDRARVHFQHTLKCCHTLFGSRWGMLSTVKTHGNVAIHCYAQAGVCFQDTWKCCRNASFLLLLFFVFIKPESACPRWPFAACRPFKIQLLKACLQDRVKYCPIFKVLSLDRWRFMLCTLYVFVPEIMNVETWKWRSATAVPCAAVKPGAVLGSLDLCLEFHDRSVRRGEGSPEPVWSVMPRAGLRTGSCETFFF